MSDQNVGTRCGHRIELSEVTCGDCEARLRASLKEAEAKLKRVGYLGMDMEIAKLEHGLAEAKKGREEDREEFRQGVAAWQKRLDSAGKDAREQRAGRDHILGLIRSTKMKHGTCQPRERKACTACNAQENLDKIVSEWKGGAVYLA